MSGEHQGRGGVGGGGEVMVRGAEGGAQMDKSDSVREADKRGRKKLRGNGEAWRMSFTDAMPSSPVTMVTEPYICGVFFFV